MSFLFCTLHNKSKFYYIILMKTIVGITNELTSTQLSQLDSFVILYNKISHKLYVDLFIKKLPIKEMEKRRKDYSP